MRRLNPATIGLTALLALTGIGAARANLLEVSTPNGQFLSPLAVPDTTTYGEVFTAPGGGYTQLNSFSFFIRGVLAQAYGGVATWTGSGTGPELFGSAPFSASFGDFTEVTVQTGGLN